MHQGDRVSTTLTASTLADQVYARLRTDMFSGRYSPGDRTFGERATEIVGNDFVLLGTLERADWRLGNASQLSQSEAANRLILFRKHLDFEIRGSWVPAD